LRKSRLWIELRTWLRLHEKLYSVIRFINYGPYRGLTYDAPRWALLHQAPRMRSSAWDTLSRFCVGRVFCPCRIPFGLRPSLLRLHGQSPSPVRRSLSYYGV
jgi:hypothetical protein